MLRRFHPPAAGSPTVLRGAGVRDVAHPPHREPAAARAAGRRRRPAARVVAVVVDSDAEAHGHDPRRRRRSSRSSRGGGLWLSGSVAGTAGGRPLLTRRASRMRAHPASGRCRAGGSTRARRRSTPPGGSCTRSWASTCRSPPCSGCSTTTRPGPVTSSRCRAAGGADPAMSPQPDEVASVHRASLRACAGRIRPAPDPGSDRPVVSAVGGDLIHADRAVLLQFRRVAIEGTTERAAGYEQPVFAWR